MLFSLKFITELYYPEETSTGYFLTKIAESLAKYYPTEVICSQPTYSKRGVRAAKSEVHNGVRIFRVASTTLDKNKLIYKFINIFTFSFSILINGLCRFKSNDIVFVVTNPPTLPLIIAIDCLIRHTKYILIVHDVYPEVLLATGLIINKSMIYRVLYWLNNIVYKRAEKVVTIGRDMRELVSKKGIALEQISVIPHWGDIDEIQPQNRNESMLLNQLGIIDKFIFQFMGNIGRTHDIEILLESSEKLSRITELYFLFIGWGAKKSVIENFIKNNAPVNVGLLPIQKREDLATVLNACDVAVLSFLEGMKGISVPSRMYNIMAAGKPILAIADPLSEIACVINEEKIGWVVPPNSPDLLIDVLQSIPNNSEKILEMGRRAREAVTKKYILRDTVFAYRKIVEEMSNG